MYCFSRAVGGTGGEESGTDTEDSFRDDNSDDDASATSGDTAPKSDLLSDPWVSLRWRDEFGREAYQTIKRGVDDNIGVDNIALELKTLRMANNADMDRVRVMVIAFFLKQMPIVERNIPKQKEAAKQVFGKWGSLITTLCHGGMSKALLRLQVRWRKVCCGKKSNPIPCLRPYVQSRITILHLEASHLPGTWKRWSIKLSLRSGTPSRKHEGSKDQT